MTYGTASPPRHFDRSPGPWPGRSGEIWQVFRRRPRYERLAGIRRRPDFSARFASVEMTVWGYALVEMTGRVAPARNDGSGARRSE